MKVIFLIFIFFINLSFAEFSKSNGVITDNITKLEWQDEYDYNNKDIKIWTEAINYCESLFLDGRGWRLPNIIELTSLIDDTKYNSSINTTFEFISSTSYWSSTTNIILKSSVWTVDFYYGEVIPHYKYDRFYVRCVRDGK